VLHFADLAMHKRPLRENDQSEEWILSRKITLTLRQFVDCLYWWALGVPGQVRYWSLTSLNITQMISDKLGVPLSVLENEVTDYRVYWKSGPDTHDHNSVKC